MCGMQQTGTWRYKKFNGLLAVSRTLLSEIRPQMPIVRCENLRVCLPMVMKRKPPFLL